MRDILKSDADYIVIPVNRVGSMGAGLAKQFADKYPEYVDAYKRWCKDRPTQILVVDRFVFLPTKDHWKDKSDFVTVRNNVSAMYYYYIPHWKGKTVAMPLVGAGLGGLDHIEVATMLYNFAEGASLMWDITTDVYDHDYRQDLIK